MKEPAAYSPSETYTALVTFFVWLSVLDLAISMYAFAAIPAFREAGVAGILMGTPHTLMSYLRIICFKAGMGGLAIWISYLAYKRAATLTITALYIIVCLMAFIVLSGAWQIIWYYL